MKYIKPVFLILLLSHFSLGFSQTNSTLNIQHVVDVPMACASLPMTMIHDQLGRPYMYVAQKEGGLTIYDISNISTPLLVLTVPTTDFDTLDVTSLTQEGNFIYLSLGNFFAGGNQYSGMAVVDVTNPLTSFVTDFWKHSVPGQGAGFVAIEGNYAYLAAMGNGLITFDVTNKSNIIFLSQFVPNINFPDPSPDPNKYNARGMEVRNDTIYLVYDAGGLRIIDVTNKLSPSQIGQYSIPDLNGLPRAYNNIILDDSLVYITIDYCGLEVLNISNPSNITQVGWWNPWGCPGNNWFTSTGHTNEIAYDANCEVLFLSSGKSEMYVIDISDPSQPDSMDVYGNTTNNLGTWGVSQYDDKIFLSYICTFIPFPGNWPGVKILSYDNSCSTSIEESNENDISIYPNPTSSMITIDFGTADLTNAQYEITTILGEVVTSKSISHQEEQINIAHYPNGIYLLLFKNKNKHRTIKIIKE